MARKPVSAHGPARLRVLRALKQLGPVAAEFLATELEVTAMAVRQHLYALESDGLASHEAHAKGRGRPLKLWSATPAADPFFTDAHAALTADLMGHLRSTFGDRGLEKILSSRTRAQVQAYVARLNPRKTLRGRLEALARIRSEEGYMAEIRRDQDGAWLIIENHCPVCAAARLCTGLCREELTLFREVIGMAVEIERSDHIIAGARRCVYRVRQKVSRPKASERNLARSRPA